MVAGAGPDRRSDGSDGSDGSDVRLRSREGRAVIAAVVLGSALAYMSDDMLNVALPSVSTDLEADVSDMQWVVNGYFVTMLSFMLTAGSVGDIRGHRRSFLAGLAVFTVGAMTAASAPALPFLVAGRAIQGIGAALVLACGLALVNGSFDEQERSQAVGVYMGLTAVATAAGPVLGGLLVDLVSWRSIFVVPLVFPVAAAVVIHLAVPETATSQDRRVDTTGAVLALVAISAFSVTLIRGPIGWWRPEVLAGSALALAAAVAFVRSQRTGADPMLPLDLFRSRTFSGGNAVTLLSFMVSAGVFLFLVVQLQTTLGYRAVSAGAALVPLYVIMLIGSPQAGRLADRIGARVPVVVGNLIMAAGIWRLSLVEPGSGFLVDVLPGLILLAIGLATLGAPLTAATLSAVPADDQGIASGVTTAVGQLAGLLMIVVLPAVAGLSGGSFGGPGFADAYPTAMRVCIALCIAAAAIAGVTIGASATPATSEQRTGAR